MLGLVILLGFGKILLEDKPLYVINSLNLLTFEMTRIVMLIKFVESMSILSSGED